MSSNCTTIQEHTPNSVDEFPIRALFGLMYSTVWIAAVVGNVFVLYVLRYDQVSLNVRSVFIGCLALSDLVMSLTSLPVTAATIFTRIWIFPAVLCKLIGVFQGGSIFVSSFTLTAIALDRCILIRKPNKDVINYSRAMLVVVGIFVFGYALALPLGIFSAEIEYQPICGSFCEEEWPDMDENGQSNQRRIYGFTVLLMQFGVPAVISSICYYLISKVMSEQLERRRGHKLLPQSEEKLVGRKTRANRMMICMVLGFICAWMPLNAINIYRDVTNSGSQKWYSTVFAFCHLCAMFSAVLNPVIYSWFNPQFRNVIKSVLSKETSTYSNVTKITRFSGKSTENGSYQKAETKVRQSSLCNQSGDALL